MDAFMNQLERLAAMAGDRADPQPLDARGVMARIQGLCLEDDGTVLSLPLRFFAGGAAAAAAAAVGISLVASAAWNDLSSPFTAMDSLLNVMDAL